jgi:hypothetical protein
MLWWLPVLTRSAARERGASMARNNRAQTALLFLLPAALLLRSSLNAGMIKEWHLQEIQQAPLLIVGQVDAVQKRYQVNAPGQLETWEMTAKVLVLRSFAFSPEIRPEDHSVIEVRFLALGPSVTACANCPLLIGLRPGEVSILPLRPNKQFDRKHWSFLEDEGSGLKISARAEAPKDMVGPKTGRDFILREMAKALSYGAPEEMSTAGVYVHYEQDILNWEMLPMLERSIGDDKQRWAAVLVNLMGSTRPNIADLRTGDWHDAHPVYSLATAILRKLPDSPLSDRLLIDALIARSSYAPELAGLLAQEYSKSPYFLSSLKVALTRRQPGAVFIACKVIEKENRSLFSYVQEAARDIVRTPEPSDFSNTQFQAQIKDREAAASLLAK